VGGFRFETAATPDKRMLKKTWKKGERETQEIDRERERGKKIERKKEKGNERRRNRQKES